VLQHSLVLPVLRSAWLVWWAPARLAQRMPSFEYQQAVHLLVHWR